MVIDEEKRNSLLFDDVDLSRSKMYFGALQHLRLYDECIHETLQNLEKLHDNYTATISRFCHQDQPQYRDDAKIVDDEFDQLLSKYREKFNLMRQRIKDKTEEIIGLRDGVRDHSLTLNLERFVQGLFLCLPPLQCVLTIIAFQWHLSA